MLASMAEREQLRDLTGRKGTAFISSVQGESTKIRVLTFLYTFPTLLYAEEKIKNVKYRRMG